MNRIVNGGTLLLSALAVEDAGVAVVEVETPETPGVEVEGTAADAAPAAPPAPRGVTAEDNRLFFKTFNELYKKRKFMSGYGKEAFEGIPTMDDEKADECVETFKRILHESRLQYQEFAAIHNGVGRTVDGIALNKGLAKRVLGWGADTQKQIKDAFRKVLSGMGIEFKA